MGGIKNKFLFKGILEMKTALHIGGGKVNVTSTDSPVVRTPEGLPFIPGSSFKGAFRGTVEKIVATLPGLRSCQLIESSNGCPTVNQKIFNPQKEKEEWDERRLIDALEEGKWQTKEGLCNTCQLFGSPYTASKIIFNDLYIQDWPGVTQIRDGVVIDRDSEKAVDGLLYNFEVVSSTSTFNMEVWLANASPTDLDLACIGFNEFLSGIGYLGGKKSRGLGNCQLTDFNIYKLDLETENGKIERLKKYLTGTAPDEKMEKLPNPQQFVVGQIQQLLNVCKS